MVKMQGAPQMHPHAMDATMNHIFSCAHIRSGGSTSNDLWSYDHFLWCIYDDSPLRLRVYLTRLSSNLATSYL